MVQKHIRMELATFKKLQKSAKNNKRSLNAEINMILESAVSIQKAGIIKDGKVEFNSISIEEELDRR